MQVAWEGAVNAHEVVPGLVRMGRREHVTDAGWRAATGAGYTTVVDLRASRELARRPGDSGGDAAAQGLAVVHAPTEDPDHPEYARRLAPYLDHPAAYDTYLLLFGDRVADALLAVARASGGVVVHCAGGRDRTGLVVALGQRLAGWSVDEVVAGYEAGASGANAHLEHHPHPRERYLAGDEWAAYVGGRTDALRSFLADLDVAGFLANEGLSDDDLDAIRTRFAR